ncbi:MAG: hypothetical protein BWY15_01095 [Firmicutes bacterium ADurb.Bin193]|nr:MAG: hypothetical protein BWY15_01095 [Firmicutes bacterium ADurb.Bin193]
MDVKVAKLEERVFRCEKDIMLLWEKVGSLSDVYLALTKVSDKVERVESDITEIKDDIKEIKKIPLKRWNSVVDTVLKVTIGALVSYALIRVGLGG